MSSADFRIQVICNLCNVGLKCIFSFLRACNLTVNFIIESCRRSIQVGYTVVDSAQLTVNSAFRILSPCFLGLNPSLNTYSFSLQVSFRVFSPRCLICEVCFYLVFLALGTRNLIADCCRIGGFSIRSSLYLVFQVGLGIYDFVGVRIDFVIKIRLADKKTVHVGQCIVKRR